ncbi:TPA: hypothetical protein GDD12_00760 [Legionella pneumophila]|nr:hypothetical protein [Legionella pneumophila]
MDNDYIRSNRYPGTVWAEKIHEHLLEAPARIIKFHTRLPDSINAPRPKQSKMTSILSITHVKSN